MRVLVVDQDSTLLTEITQTLGEYFSIDAVTNKADGLDLVRVNEFDVIVAGERLQDGSGLELLGQLAHSRPDVLRIFAADRERLRLLKGRLGPFGLFRTLSYPIEPRQLLAALSAAAGFDEEFEEPQEESPPAPEVPQPPSRAAVPTPVAVSAPTRGHAQARPQTPTLTVTASQPPATVASATSQTNTSPTRTNQRVSPSVGAEARSHAPRQTHASSPAVNASPPTRVSGGSGPETPTRGTPRVSDPTGTASRVPRQPTPEALALGSRLSRSPKPKGSPPPLIKPSAKRRAFLVGAGVVVVLGIIGLAFRLSHKSDDPAVRTTTFSAPPSFPPDVVKLIADTETAIENDDFRAAQTDIAALQQIAPTHPRLPFLESFLEREEMAAELPKSPTGSARSASRRMSSRKAGTTPGTVKRPGATVAETPSSDSKSSGPTSPTITSPKQPSAVAIFGGTTVEEDSGPQPAH